jgi:hypothetical protein
LETRLQAGYGVADGFRNHHGAAGLPDSDHIRSEAGLSLRRHVLPVLALAVWTGVWLLPLLVRLSTALPGSHAGDNVTFVWNLWWMRYVLHHPGYSFFSTPFLFHPFGADLTLHTHTALPALLAAAGPSSLIASQNLLIVVHLFLNFLCSYALGYRTTARRIPALAAAIVFGASPFVDARLTGHFNLIAAWILPLICVVAARAADHASAARVGLVGAVLAAAAYTDYYLFIYSVVLLAGLAVFGSVTISRRSGPRSPRFSRALLTIGVLLLCDAVLMAGILWWHPDRIHAGPWRISVRSIDNPLTAAWLLVIAGCLLGIRARVTLAWTSVRSWQSVRAVLIVAGVWLVLAAPLVIHGVRLWNEGRYVSQAYRWRSAPGGVDVATLLLGNPFHAVWGEAVRGLYRSAGIDPIESSAWIPVAALILAAVAVARRRSDAAVRLWMAVGAGFLTWALGPWLMLLGRQTPILLPALVVRYVPIIANARIPGRAMVVVYLAVAMLAAIGAAWLQSGLRRSRLVGGMLIVLLAIESVPAWPPVFVPHVPAQYAALKDRPRAGAVCELPFGIRDGFGETGRFDASVLLHQTVHERPLVGGFLARLSPSVARDYAAMPVIGSFLRLSSGGTLSQEPVRLSPKDAASSLSNAGIAFIVIDTRAASPDLLHYLQADIAARLIGEEDGRLFYEVE